MWIEILISLTEPVLLLFSFGCDMMNNGKILIKIIVKFLYANTVLDIKLLNDAAQSTKLLHTTSRIKGGIKVSYIGKTLYCIG